MAEQTMDAYGYCYQNPINLVDPTGMSASDPNDYVFDENGHYVRTDINDDPDMLVIENSKTKDKTFYTFNDPKNDVESIEYQKKQWGEELFKEIQFVFAIDDKWMDYFKKESDIHGRNYISRNFFAKTESVGGKMDASVYLLPIVQYATDNHYHYGPQETMNGHGAMFIFQHDGYRAYNHMDAGNFIWGNFMIGIGFNLSQALDAARGYNKEDSGADLNAIQRGATLQRNNVYGPLPLTNKIINEYKK